MSIEEVVAVLPRRSGALGAAEDAAPGDHACMSYRSAAGRIQAVVDWLRLGLERNERTMYVYDASMDELRAEVADLPDGDAAIESGALVLAPTRALYDLSVPIDPSSQLAMYDQAVRQAIADGYQGLRIAADITPLVLDASRRPSHLRWEQIADRYMTQHPLAPLCLYDASVLPDLDAIAAAHPLQGPGEPMFAVYGMGPATAVVEGELDGCVAAALEGVLAGLPDTDRQLDLRRLSFVDARAASILHLELHNRISTGRPLTVTGASPMFRKVWQLCGFDADLLAA